MKRALRWVILRIEAAFGAVFGPRLNPIVQLGTPANVLHVSGNTKRLILRRRELLLQLEDSRLQVIRRAGNTGSFGVQIIQSLFINHQFFL